MYFILYCIRLQRMSPEEVVQEQEMRSMPLLSDEDFTHMAEEYERKLTEHRLCDKGGLVFLVKGVQHTKSREYMPALIESIEFTRKVPLLHISY